MKKTMKEKGFTIVEMLVVIALIAIVGGMAGFSVTRLVNETREDQDLNNVFGMLLTTRAKAMGNNVTYIAVLNTNSLQTYSEAQPGSLDIISLSQSLQNGTLPSVNLNGEINYQFKRMSLVRVEMTGSGGGSATAIAIPVYLGFLPNGKVMVNGANPLDVGNLHLIFRPSNTPIDRHIVIYPYTGRMIAK